MRKTTQIIAVILLLSLLAGCRSNIPQDTQGSITTNPTTEAPQTTAPTQPASTGEPSGQSSGSVNVLKAVWNRFGEDEKFSTYGGSIENAVMDAPGALDLSVTDELTGAYLLPADKLSYVTEGASLVHMMNANIFTAVVVKVEGNQLQALFEAWRDIIQSNRWICGQPDRLLMVDVDGSHLLMSFGSNDAMDLFQGKLAEAWPAAKTLYDQAIVS